MGIIRKIYSKTLEQKRIKYIQRLIGKGLRLGKNVEIIDSFFFDPSHCFLISIGNNCTICPNVRLIAHDASTKNKLGYTKIGRIDIKENVFIGDSVIILPGVTIGANSVIGAGAVVTRNIPPGSIAAGNPARIMGTVEKYYEKMKGIKENKKLFDKEYYIEKLNAAKRREILESINDSIGFIV